MLVGARMSSLSLGGHLPRIRTWSLGLRMGSLLRHIGGSGSILQRCWIGLRISRLATNSWRWRGLAVEMYALWSRVQSYYVGVSLNIILNDTSLRDTRATSAAQHSRYAKQQRHYHYPPPPPPLPPAHPYPQASPKLPPPLHGNLLLASITAQGRWILRERSRRIGKIV
ncbi:hypothetical protein BJX64DRAFT_14167 [Aspergillus heterothallicus]